MSEVRFELKNGKIYTAIVVFTIFFLIGVWVFLHSGFGLLNPLLIKILSLAYLLFFGIIIYFCVKAVFSKRVGLIICKNGITDRTSLLSFGFISEKSIKKVKIERIENGYYLFIELSDKDKYLNSENDYISRLLKENMKKYDCEIVISLSNLKCSFEDIEEVINATFKEKLQ
jgi:hypothetical protein